MEKSYSEIQIIDENSIIFIDGFQIQLTDREGNYYDKCVAERDITAKPPYFSFFDGNKIVFDEKGLFAKNKNKKNFLALQQRLENIKYSTYDLS